MSGDDAIDTCEDPEMWAWFIDTSASTTGDGSATSFEKRRRVASPLKGCREVHSSEVKIGPYDVIIGDTHQPTLGTTIYRIVRGRYAKRKLSEEELRHMLNDLQQALEEDAKRSLPSAVLYISTSKQGKFDTSRPVAYRTDRPDKGPYGVATAKTILEDVKSAPKGSRRKTTFHFRGNLSDVLEAAHIQASEWAGTDRIKQPFVQSYNRSVQQLSDMHSEVVQQWNLCCSTVGCEGQARMYELEARQLESRLIPMINQLGNDMLDRYRQIHGTEKAVPSPRSLSRNRTPSMSTVSTETISTATSYTERPRESRLDCLDEDHTYHERTAFDISHLDLDDISVSSLGSRDSCVLGFSSLNLMALELDADEDHRAGHASLQQGDWNEAVRRLEKALSRMECPSALLYYDLGSAYDKKQDWDKAIDNFERALVVDPGNAVELHTRLEQVYAKKGCWREARYQSKMAKEARKDLAERHYSR